MSKAVLQDDGFHSGPGAEQAQEEDCRREIAADTARCCGSGGGGGGGCQGSCVEATRGGGGRDGSVCGRTASVGSHTRNNNNDSGGGNTRPRTCGPDACARGTSNDSRRQICGGGDLGLGGSGGASRTSSPGPRLVNGRARSAPRNGCGFEAYCSSPEDSAAAAVSSAPSAGGCGRGGDRDGGEAGPAILAVLRETAAAGGGMRIRAGAPRREKC